MARPRGEEREDAGNLLLDEGTFTFIRTTR
jgi:hypothetical protein